MSKRCRDHFLSKRYPECCQILYSPLVLSSIFDPSNKKALQVMQGFKQRIFSKLSGLLDAFARNGNLAGADKLLDAHRPQKLHKGLDLLLFAGNLDRIGLGA